MVKLLENTFRSVNIGLVNELALLCDRMGIDVWDVIDAAATKPFGFMPFYPGSGLGRPLHPDRSVLPLLEGAGGRLRGSLHRTRGSGQLLHAANTSWSGSRRAELDPPERERLEGPRPRRRLQGRHRRPARISRARHPEATRGDGGAEFSTTTRIVPSLDVGEIHLESVDLTDDALRRVRLRRPDHRPQGVALRPHSRAESRLVVDTRNGWKGVSSPKLHRL